MDKFDIYDWKFKKLIKESQDIDDVTEFVENFRTSIQDFVKSHSQEEAENLLMRLSRMIRDMGGLSEAKENPCWDGYEMVGMKEKDGKPVPNCVPTKK